MKLTHVVESRQFTLPLLQELFARARQMERVVARGGTLDHQDRIMATLFYEPSTRTRLCFEAAMLRLGGRVLSTEQARLFSSEVEGEHLEDTIRTIAAYCDCIVLRHGEPGGARRAARVSKVPILNAGDGGGGEHPTQALLDLYTIWRQRGSLDGLSIAIAGDLDRGRTARSLALLLSKFERVRIFFVSPPEVGMGADILRHLEEHQVWTAAETELSRVLPEVDVVYQTRLRPERLASRPPASQNVIDGSMLAKMRDGAMILHPLPRTVEIDPAVDADPRAFYFKQAENGLYVRMALLTMIWEGEPA